MSVNLNRASSYIPRPQAERSSRSNEDSQQSLGAGYAYPPESLPTQHWQNGTFNPILSSHSVEIQQVDPRALESQPHTLGSFSIGILARYVPDATVVSMIIRVLNDSHILNGLHVLRVPSYLDLEDMLGRYRLTGFSNSLPLVEVVLMGLLGGLTSFRSGALGMVDLESLSAHIPPSSVDIVMQQLQRMGALSPEFEIMMIPAYDECERVFGKKLARLAREYLMARRGHWVVGGDSGNRGWLSLLWELVLGSKR